MVERSADDYEGFFTRPMGWRRAVEKFHTLASYDVDERLRTKIARAVEHLEEPKAKNLTSLLGRVKAPP